MPGLSDYALAALSGAADSLVIFLHGLGDSGAGGLLEIGRMWQRALPNTAFLCPDAPFAYDMAPPDFTGKQWFSLRDFSQRAIDAGVRTAAPILDAYIDDALAARALPPSRLALVGFSQGTMMALHTGLRRAEAVAGIVGYSGMLACSESIATEKKSSPPLLLIHGTADEVVPFAAMDEAERVLKATAIPVRTLACPRLGHGIDDAGIAAGQAFLQHCLSVS